MQVSAMHHHGQPCGVPSPESGQGQATLSTTELYSVHNSADGAVSEIACTCLATGEEV